MPRNPLMPLIFAMFLAGCDRPSEPAASADPALALPASAEGAQSLLDVDREFAAMSAAQGVRAAFEQNLARDALFLPADSAPVHGRDAVLALIGTARGASWAWVPEGAQVAASGELGYTWGTYEYRAGEGAFAAVEYGKYLSVWRREPDGRWRVVAEMSNRSPVPGPPTG
jgi:ketosteroid isomerase-like protein